MQMESENVWREPENPTVSYVVPYGAKHRAWKHDDVHKINHNQYVLDSPAGYVADPIDPIYAHRTAADIVVVPPPAPRVPTLVQKPYPRVETHSTIEPY